MSGRKNFFTSLFASIYVHVMIVALLLVALLSRLANMQLVLVPEEEYNELAIELMVENGSGEGEQKGEGEGKGSGSGGEGELDVDQQKWGDLLNRLDDSQSLKRYKETFDNVLPNSGVSDSYIHRKRHYEDITVKEVFPTLSTIDKPFSEIIEHAAEDLNEHQERNEVIRKYRKWKKGELSEQRLQTRLLRGDRGRDGRDPLTFPSEARDRYFDSTLTLPKEDQLLDFVNRYMDYNPDKGDLPIATRELYYKNLQRIAYTFSSDSTYGFLDYYEENLNKEEFLKHSLYQVSRLKGSKTMTEFLFSLHDIYEIQQRALSYYFQFQQMYPSMSPEKKRRLHIETLRRVDKRYQKLVQEKKLKNRNDVIEAYTKKRLEIIDFLIANSPEGYRLPDALYDKARLHWERGMSLGRPEEMDEAVRQWRELYRRMGLKGLAPSQIVSPVLAPEKEDQKPLDIFKNEKALQKMIDYLDQYAEGDEQIKNQMRGLIHSIVDIGRRESIQEKIKREKELLWK